MVKKAHWILMIASFLFVNGSFADEAPALSTAGEDSFARIEALDRNIEQAGKEIDAMKVDQQLKTLQDQAKKMSMDFAVARIYGVDHDLMAMLQFNNKAVLVYKTGDLIENRFKITEIQPDFVRVYDQTNRKSMIVPFL